MAAARKFGATSRCRTCCEPGRLALRRQYRAPTPMDADQFRRRPLGTGWDAFGDGSSFTKPNVYAAWDGGTAPAPCGPLVLLLVLVIGLPPAFLLILISAQSRSFNVQCSTNDQSSPNRRQPRLTEPNGTNIFTAPFDAAHSRAYP